MNMLQLLNPTHDGGPCDDMGRICFDSVHVDPVQSARPDRINAMEDRVETTVAATSLMMLGTKNKTPLGHRRAAVSKAETHRGVVPTVAIGHMQEASRAREQAVRSPMVFPIDIESFHLSPIAEKLAMPTSWKDAQPRLSRLASGTTGLTPRAADLKLVPAPPNLKRRLCSISAMAPVSSNTGTPTDGSTREQSTTLDVGAHYCSVTGCLRSATHQGKCAVHKGMKLCQADGCNRPVQSRGCCKSHGGGARCKYPGCIKGAISKGRCRSHGGGTRCAMPNCTKWAQRFGCCVRHSKGVGFGS